MHSIWEELLDDVSFGLFAIHSQLEDHSLAYALNKACGFNLSRLANDLELGKSAVFPVYYWNDIPHFREWSLFKNKVEALSTVSGSGLFSDVTSQRRFYLIPEKKEIDYFLKVEGDENPQGIVEKILKIPRLVTAYQLESSILKSKHNLIH